MTYHVGCCGWEAEEWCAYREQGWRELPSCWPLEIDRRTEPFQNVHWAIRSGEIQQLKAPRNCRDGAVLQEMPASLILPSRLVAFLIDQRLGKNPETCLDVPYSCLVINWTCYYRSLICHHSNRVDWCLFHCTVSHKGRWQHGFYRWCWGFRRLLIFPISHSYCINRLGHWPCPGFQGLVTVYIC